MPLPSSAPPVMTEYASTLELSDAAQMLRDVAGPIVVLTHAKPDGDAFGSVIALAATLRKLGKTVHACFVPPVPATLLDLRGSELASVYKQGDPLPEGELYVVLDTGAWSQLGPMRAVVEPNLDRTLILDHHLSGDVPAKHRYIDGQAAACCEVIAELVECLLDTSSCGTQEQSEAFRVICEALFVGIAADTGWFRFSNTRPQTHELAAKLLRYGVDQAALYQQLEQTERPEKLALLIRALDSLKLLADGKAAVMVLRGHDFEETGAFEEETERLIDIPQQVGTIQVIVLASEKLVDVPDGPPQRITRISFRSKPGKDAVNVAELASQFGGGGHARAAGARVEQPIDQVLPGLEKAVSQAVGVSD